MQTDPNTSPGSPHIYEADYRVNEDGTIERSARRRSWLRGALGPIAAILLFVGTKLKFLLAALKGVKFFGTGISALLSIGAYALYFGWQFAVGLVVLVFIHEMGHVLVLRRYGVKATAPIFIPFMGAFIGMKQLPKNAVMEAWVGLGGPIVGSLGALGAWVLYSVTDNTLFLVMTFIGVLLNLFNLLPILPLDGGRAVGAISRWFWPLGFAGLLALIVTRPSPILFLILLMGGAEAWSRFRGAGREERGYYTVAPRDRATISATYFGLLLTLGFTLYELESLVHAFRP
jgi:Zn-dependent protease